MCGIFGFVANSRSGVTPAALTGLLRECFLLSEKRGREAAGLALMCGDKIEIFKRPGQARHMIRLAAYRSFVEDFMKQASGRTVVAIGHSRLVTNGTEAMAENNQPVVTDHCVGVHNGIVVNVQELLDRHADLERQTELDSEVIFRLIDRECDDGGDVASRVAAAYAEVAGAASIAFMHDRLSGLALATNTGSLYTAASSGHGLFLFASERYTLAALAKRNSLPAHLGETGIEHLAAGSGIVVDETAAVAKTFRLEGAATNAAGNDAAGTTARFTRTISGHAANADNIRRCTSCVLPETFPFIQFDEQGVCNLCRDHEERRLHGLDALRRIADQHRRNDGEADCLVAFSGGRDSSYGLHFIKQTLGMTPIAFTYDWGMVTNLARRNQARICGKLGVEHIIRSPHIPTKRRNIRRNVETWLRKPVLGMIPLLMAGDKQMYQVGRDLRRETGIRLVLFCAGNELERTEFKTGFCGIRENAHGQVLWKYSLANKIRLALYYGGQFVLNPHYFNASVIDSLSAYYAAYIGKDDFAYLYHYIPWDEHEIDRTLRGEYGWETAEDSPTTWRVGDGTAAFYNYIYYTVAGFSEHDTFRSNQIRAGLIGREEALRLLRADNAPRFASMRDYAALVGFNLDEALLVINAIPKLY